MAAVHAAAFTRERSWSAAEFEDLLASPFVFATGDARAFALVRVVADEAELLTIATDPAHRRRGLARALMEAWQAEAARRGATRAFLEVAADNAGAMALYRAAGFAETARRRVYYARRDGPAVDAVIMSRALTIGHPPQP